MLSIVNAPNAILSQTAKKVVKFDRNVQKLINDMEKALVTQKDPEGVGLAAPQIGKSLRIFIMKPTPKAKCTVVINPEILETTKGKKEKSETTKLEGCLSLPQIWGEVERNESITLSYQDETGRTHTKKFTGFLATIVQHEVDHLNGILFPKRVLEGKGALYKSHKDKQGKEIFDPIDL